MTAQSPPVVVPLTPADLARMEQQARAGDAGDGAAAGGRSAAGAGNRGQGAGVGAGRQAMSEPLSDEQVADIRHIITSLEFLEETSGVPIWWGLGRRFNDGQVRGLLALLAERDAALETVTRENAALREAGDALADAMFKVASWTPVGGVVLVAYNAWRALTQGVRR